MRIVRIPEESTPVPPEALKIPLGLLEEQPAEPAAATAAPAVLDPAVIQRLESLESTLADLRVRLEAQPKPAPASDAWQKPVEQLTAAVETLRQEIHDRPPVEASATPAPADRSWLQPVMKLESALESLRQEMRQKPAAAESAPAPDPALGKAQVAAIEGKLSAAQAKWDKQFTDFQSALEKLAAEVRAVRQTPSAPEPVPDVPVPVRLAALAEEPLTAEAPETPSAEREDVLNALDPVDPITLPPLPQPKVAFLSKLWNYLNQVAFEFPPRRD